MATLSTKAGENTRTEPGTDAGAPASQGTSGRREFIIGVRVNAAERAALRRMAAAERAPVAVIVRRLIRQAALEHRRARKVSRLVVARGRHHD